MARGARLATLAAAVGALVGVRRLARALAVPAPASVDAGGWVNWSGGQRCRPGAILAPRDEAELAEAVAASTGVLRPVGGGHSFTPLVPTEGQVVSLDHIAGVTEVDTASRRAWVRAGTRLRDLSPALAAHGLALPNLGDIDVQSVAGAIATATHGTGRTLPCLSAQVRGVRLLLADGSTRTATLDDDPDFVHAAQVSLGALGVLLDVQLQLRTAFRLHRRSWVAPTREAVAQANERWQAHRHFEFFALPFADRSLCITHDLTDRQPTPPVDGDDDATLMQVKLVRDLTWRAEPVRRRVLAMALSGIEDDDAVDASWRLLPASRQVPFEEMEYHLPVETGLDAFREVLAWMEANRPDTWFPIEVRRTAGDAAWLSPFQGGGRISVAVHAYAHDAHDWFAHGVEPILRRHGGRPHWGKRHGLGHDDLHRLYPDLGRFVQLRRSLDPYGRFLSPYLRRLLEPA